MSHEITEDRAVFGHGQGAWHNIGEVFPAGIDVPTAADKLMKGQHFIEEPCYRLHDGQFIEVPGRKHVVRTDNVHIGDVGKDYELYQASELFADAQALIDTGLVELDSGAVLRNGSQMFLSMTIADAVREVAKNDTIRGHILASVGFDGSMALFFKNVATRTVCANTLAQAIGEKVTKNTPYYKMKHTKNMRDRVLDAKQAIIARLQGLDEQVAVYKTLVSKRMTQNDMEEYIASVFVSPDTPEDEITTQQAKKVMRVIELIDTQKGLELVPAIRGTAWQAYNAVSQYLTYEQGRTDETRFQSLYFGDAGKLNQHALKLAQAA